jgi:hypothetical protein
MWSTPVIGASAIAICALALTPNTAFARQVQRRCSVNDAMRAEDEANSLQQWSAVYRSYERFGHCDDGAIAEGYSASVVRLLIDKWPTIDQLNNLVQRNKGFQGFVLRHLDELISAEESERIRANASGKCPQNANSLCVGITARLDAVAGKLQR